MLQKQLLLLFFLLGLWGNSWAQLTLSGTFTATDKEYDGLTTATLNQNNLSLIGVTPGNDVSLGTITIAFDSKTAGTAKIVRITNVVLTGADAASYTVNLTGAPTTTASITKKNVQISGTATIGNKEYDGTTTASIVNSNSLTLLGRVGTDLISLSNLTAAFEDKSVGTGKAVRLITATLSGNDAGNYTLIIPTSPIGLANITTKQLSITGSFIVADKIYDGNTTATISDFSGLTLFGVLNNEDVSIISPKAVFSNKQAGNGKAVQLTEAYLSGDDAPNYTVTVSGAPFSTASIKKKQLTVGGSLPISNKVYDGTVVATVSNISALSLVGRVTGDQVTITQPTVQFNNKNVGTGKTVTLTSIVLAGTDAANYTFTLNNAPTGSATITAKSLSLLGNFTVEDKVYNGNRTSTILTNNLTLDGVVTNDDVSINTIQALFDTSLPGSGKQVSLSTVTLAGVDAANYTTNIATAPKTTGTITTKELSIAGSFTVANKTYDGAITASITNSAQLTLSGVISGDQVSLTGLVATFLTKEAGESKTAVLTSASLTGANADRYTLSLANAPTTTAQITAKELTLSGSFSVSNKVYDGNAAAAVTSFDQLVLNGIVGADQVNLFQIQAQFASKTVGTGKVVSINSAELTGSDATNYTVATSGNATTLADITQKSITVGGSFTVNSKPYDASTLASINNSALSLVGTISGDDIFFNSIQIDFATPTPGTGKQVSITSIVLGGSDAANYELILTGAPTAVGTITRKILTLSGSFTASNKTYDGTDDALITNSSQLVLTGIVGSEQVSFIGLTAKFDTKNVGTNKTVRIIAGALDGTDKDNYSLDVTGAPTTTATISGHVLTLTGSFTADSKVYDANRTATIAVNNLQLNGIKGNDIVSIGTLTLLFDTALPGQNKTVSISAVTLTGEDAANYSVDLSNSPTSTAEINRKEISISGSFVVADKIYDGTTVASISTNLFTLTGIINNEVVDLSSVTAEFAEKNVGTDISVSIKNAVLTGADANNYQLTYANAPTALADILAKELTVTGSFTVSDKVYDGNVQATVSNASQLQLNGIITNETVTLTAIQAEFDSKTVGIGKTVSFISATLMGIDASNYVLNTNSVPSTTATITQKQVSLTGNITALSKVYDGNVNAQVATNSLEITGIISGDIVKIEDANLNLVFDSAVPGNDKLVSIVSVTLTGSDAQNYSLLLVSAPTTTASITAKPLTLSGAFSVADKVYDGTTTASITSIASLTLVGIVETEQVQLNNPSAVFDSKDVGENKIVQLTSASLTGVHASNYTLSLVGAPTSTASITGKMLTLSGSITVQSKEYDGNRTATLLSSTVQLVGIEAGDNVTIQSLFALFDTKNVGVNKSVSIDSVTFTGSDATNYSYDLTNAPTATATIFSKSVTISGAFTVSDKMYDASKDATLTDSLSLILNGIIEGENVTLSLFKATFSDSLVGNNKAVSLKSVTLSGANSSNYVLDLTSAPQTTASILAKELTLSGSFTASSKVYDGLESAEIINSSDLELNGVVGTETVTVTNLVALFDSKTAGKAKPVRIISADLTGADVANYVLSIANAPTTTADIETKELTILGILAVEDKEYDGTTHANVTSVQAELNGVIPGDVVEIDTLSIEYQYATPGTDIPVTITGVTLKGVDALNYTIDDNEESPNTVASIIPKKIQFTGSFVAVDKVYDGTKRASIQTDSSLSLDGIIGTEEVRFDSLKAEFSDKNIGSAKIVRLTSAQLFGADSANYVLDFSNSPVAEASITSKTVEIVGTLSVLDRVYDGTLSVTIQDISQFTLTGVIPGDTLSFQDVRATVETKNAAEAKTVRITAATLIGADSLNYKWISNLVSTANIFKREVGITGSFTASNKVYDATPASTVATNNLSLTNTISGDDIALDSVEINFVQSGIGEDIQVSIINAMLTGADSSNYELTLENAPVSNADITPKMLTLSGSFSVDSKMYDATTNADILNQEFELNGFISGETANIDTLEAKFSSPNAGINIPVTLTKATINGLNASNYDISLENAPQSTGTITPKNVSIEGVVAQDKVYDATVTATLSSIGTLTGLIGVETLTLNNPASVEFETKDVGSNLAVTASGYTLSNGTNGGLANNYVLNSDSVIASASITKAPLTITANDHTIIQKYEPYEGGNGVVFSGFVGEETETVLLDSLRYSGSSQGAENPGTYEIIPGGLTSTNYEISFVPGILTILTIPKAIDPRPAQNATRVRVDAEVSVAFSVDVVAGPNLSDVAIRLEDQTLLENVTARLVNKRLVFSHPSFTNLTTYTLFIPEGAVLSANQVPNEEFYLTFTTVRALPKVRNTIPQPDVRAIQLDTEIKVTFDQEITAVDLDQIRISDPQNVRVNNVAVSLLDSVTLGIEHPDFNHSTIYTVTIPAGSVQNEDAVVNEEYKWSFRTILTPPSVATLSPLAGATKVAVDAAISVTLNQDVSAVDLNRIRVYTANGDTLPNLNIFLIGRTITIGHPPFQNNLTYVVDIPAGAIQNTDNIGNERITWNFSVIKTQPVFSVISPRNGAGGVAIDTLLSVTFDQKITLTSTTGVQIRDDANRTVSSVLVTLIDSTIQISHAPFLNNRTYTVTVPANFVRNEDQLGNQGLSWSFRTIRSRPIAQTLLPENRAENVDRNTPIRIVFDQNISMVNPNGISMREQSGVIVDGLTTEMESDNAILITVPPLKYATQYVVSIDAGTVQNQDLIQNNAITWSFETVIEPPAVPQLTGPVNDDRFVNQKPTFTWQASARAQTYEIQIGLSPVFDAIVKADSGLTLRTYSVDLSPLTKYAWRVRAANNGGKSEWSETFEFTTKATTPVLTFPNPSQTNVSTAPFLRWTQSDASLIHEVQLSTNAQFTAGLRDTLVQDVTIQWKGLLAKKQYFWRVKVNDDIGSSEWSVARAFTTRPNPNELENRTVTATVEFAKTKGAAQRIPTMTDYKLISMPGSETIPLYEFFPDEYMTQWRAFAETGSETGDFFEEYNPRDSSMSFSTGKGFWIISKSPLSIRRGFSSVTPNSLDAYAIPVHRGWNIIANPYQSTVDWNFTQELNGIVADLYSYDKLFTKVTSMEAFKGYYFYNDPTFGLEELLIPFSNSAQTGVPSSSVSDDLSSIPHILLKAVLPNETQHEVEFVFDDKLEDYKPVASSVMKKEFSSTINPSEENVILERVHPRLTLAESGLVIATDFDEASLRYERKRALLEQDTFVLQLKAKPGETVQLTPKMTHLPESTQLLLVNKLTKVMTRLSSRERTNLKITEPLSTFDVYVGSEAYLDEISASLLPVQFALEQNYPNPFNPSTVIRYSLSNDASVKLEVYDVLGRRIQTLVNTKQQAGWYTIEFNGTHLSSGVYLYRLQAGNFVQIQKMTLVK